MAEYIDKKYLGRKFQIDMMCLRGGTIFDTQNIIDSLPTADVVPVIHAKWIHKRVPIGNGEYIRFFQCSNCDELSNSGSNYCPNCGAKMDLKESD